MKINPVNRGQNFKGWLKIYDNEVINTDHVVRFYKIPKAGQKDELVIDFAAPVSSTKGGAQYCNKYKLTQDFEKFIAIFQDALKNREDIQDASGIVKQSTS